MLVLQEQCSCTCACYESCMSVNVIGIINYQNYLAEGDQLTAELFKLPSLKNFNSKFIHWKVGLADERGAGGSRSPRLYIY